LGLRTPNLGKGEAVGVGVVSLDRPSIVTFHLSLRVSEILPLLCSSAPLFPTPSLVSPKFPHVPLGIGGWPLGYEERRCWANCPCISFQCDPDSPTSQTDGQTDVQTTCNLNTALCTKVHRAVKTITGSFFELSYVLSNP